jgi:hypothetical protein
MPGLARVRFESVVRLEKRRRGPAATACLQDGALESVVRLEKRHRAVSPCPD